MYIRFVSSMWDDEARCRAGIFTALETVRSSLNPDILGTWHRTELVRLGHWFDDQLAAPDWVGRRAGRGYRAGVCWFRSEAQQHVSEARYMAWLLADLGLPVDEVKAHTPGQILWQDAHQVVAIPRRT